MEIKILAKCDAQEFTLPDNYGYESEYIYEVARSETDKEIEFKVVLQELSKPYKKIWNEDEATINRYKQMIEDGISLSVSTGNRTAGVLIAEKRDWNNSAYIEKLHVADEFKHKGVGSLMMKEFARLAGINGYRLIYLETQNTNYPAIQFYRKNGFDLSGIDLKLYDGKDNLNEVAIFMTKDLPQSG